ncbi:MAG: DUF4860 domain-containing protein [Eubacterium sp.]|nr:DUF4860 domain-containing protein [Eubacterium sp.]
MAKMKSEKHNIDGAFVLVLFAVFAVTIVAVLALGANSYKKLVERDEDSYNRRIITSYVTAKIRENDSMEALEVGGFTRADTPDGIDTLHMYQTIEGEVYDTRIYFYDNHIYELLTLADIKINPDAGSPIMEAKGLSFQRNGNVVEIVAKDAEGREGTATVALRSGSEVAP